MAMHDIGNRPAQATLTITAGDHWSRTPTLTGIDLTGCSMRGQVRKTAAGDTVAPIECTVTNASTGALLWKLDVPSGIGGCGPKDPDAQYVGEIELVGSLGKIRTLLRLTIVILAEAARAT